MTQSELHASPAKPARLEVVTRWLVAGPLVLIASALTMAGMSSWLPQGRAGLDHLAFPLILFPAIWAAMFFYAVLESKPWRAGLVILVIGAGHAIPVVSAVTTMMAARAAS